MEITEQTGRGLPFVSRAQRELSCFQVTYELNNQRQGKEMGEKLVGVLLVLALCKSMLFNIAVTQLEENHTPRTAEILEFQDAP